MLSKIISEAPMSISNQNFHKKSFIIETQSIHIDASLESLLRCIENMLNHSSRKYHDTLTIRTMAAPSFT